MRRTQADKLLAQRQADKLFRQGYTEEIRRLAELRYFQRVTIVNSRTGTVRAEVYGDLAQARVVAQAVLLLEIKHQEQLKWNKDELRLLFNNRSRPRSS